MILRHIAAGFIAALSVNAAPAASPTASADSITRSGSQRINGTIYAGGVRFGEDLREISADITVPTCSVGQPYSPYSTYESDGWVGMGGYSKVGGLIQTGVSCFAQKGTSTSYKIWTEYFPALQDFYNDTDIQAGDVISARVVAHNKTSGTTYLHNKRTGKRYSTTYINQTSELTFRDVEWITESRLYLNILGPQGHLDAKYTPWQFRDARYVSKDGKKHKSHKFELVSGSHMLYTILNGVKIAEGVYDRAGHIQVHDTTPANYTLPGFYG